jgi:hypothetical protein
MFVGDADNQNTSISTQCVVDDACIIRQNLTTMALDFRAGYVSMNADGFTVGFSNLSSQRFFSSLCLAGEDYALGVEAKTTSAATASESITGPGFEPAAVLLGMQANVTATATGVQHARFAIGASDGTNERAAVNSSQDNIGTSVVDSYMASAKAIVKSNNATPAIDAEADLAMTATGFDLSWTTNDAVATLVPWIAFGPVGGVVDDTPTGTDSQAIGSSEAATLAAAMADSDSQAVASTEAGTLAAAILATDTQAIASDESGAVGEATTPATDTQAIGSDEAGVVSFAASATDSQAIGSDETATLNVFLADTDAQAIGSDEAGVVPLEVVGDDSQAIGSDEAAVVAALYAATDAQAIGSGESISVAGDWTGVDPDDALDQRGDLYLIPAFGD